MSVVDGGLDTSGNECVSQQELAAGQVFVLNVGPYFPIIQRSNSLGIRVEEEKRCKLSPKAPKCGTLL